MGEPARGMIIAVDGPAGVGKSTVTMAIARELGLTYVETGALYRAVGYLARQRGVDTSAAAELAGLARTMRVTFRLVEDVNHVLLDGADVTIGLRSPEMGPIASQVSSIPEVRAALLDVQRGFARKGKGVVAEGRDIGTVVFPDADFKFFIVADPAERARRRDRQLEKMGRKVDFDSLKQEIEERDRMDSDRAVAPLRAADDAVIIDTTHLSAARVVSRILAHIRTGGVE